MVKCRWYNIGTLQETKGREHPGLRKSGEQEWDVGHEPLLCFSSVALSTLFADQLSHMTENSHSLFPSLKDTCCLNRKLCFSPFLRASFKFSRIIM